MMSSSFERFGKMCIEIIQKIWGLLNGISLSDAIAFFALIVSFSALAVQIIFERKNRKRNLFADTFREYLVKKVPEGRSKVEKVNGKWKTKELQRVLSDFKKDILYFKYYDTSFYEKVCKIIIEIDDFVVDANNRNTDETYMMQKMDALIHSLYDTITKAYFSGGA